VPTVNTRQLALERLEGQLAALVLMGQDIRPVLAEVAELRREVLQRPAPAPSGRQLSMTPQAQYLRSYRARKKALRAARWAAHR